MPTAHVEAILGLPSIPGSLREAVRRAGAWISFRPLAQAVQSGVSSGADAVIIVLPEDTRDIEHPLRVLLKRLADRPRPVLLLRADGGEVPPLAHPDSVPVTRGGGTSVEELATRLETMLDLKASLAAMHRSVLAHRRLGERANRRYERQLRLARQVQREFMPENLPRFGPISFRAVFRPTEFVSGDIYDIHRLDEEHVAIALADATGHGIPAALLTVFVKRALRGKEIHQGRYRILPPNEVLSRLNEDLLEANLSECRFIAATYAVLNTRTLELELARGGAPYPLVRRADGSLQLLRPAGEVIGVLPEASFAVETVQLEPGDAVVLLSDGAEAVALHRSTVTDMAGVFSRAAQAVHDYEPPVVAVPERQPVPALVAGEGQETVPLAPSVVPTGLGVLDSERPAWGGGDGPVPGEELASSSWGATLREAGTDAALEQFVVRYETLRRLGHPLDDVTVLTVEVGN